MQQQMHIQSQPHMRSSLGPSPPRLISLHGPPTHHPPVPPPTSVPNMHPNSHHHHQSHQSSPITSQRAPLSKLQSHNMSPQGQPNAHYTHSHQHQQNGETRPSVIESSQPLIIECT